MVTWLVLIALTLGSFALAESLSSINLVAALGFGIAAIKGDLVMTRFMELHTAAPHWRGLYRGWLIVVTVLLIGAHVLDRSAAPIATPTSIGGA